jgi:Zn-dependent metalloprotease
MRSTSPLSIILASFITTLLPISPAARAVTIVPVKKPSGTTLKPLPPNPDAQGELNRLASVTQPWQATWDSDTGYIRMLFNGETAPVTGSLETAARQFVKAHGQLFGLTDDHSLQKAEGLTHKLGETVRFRQTYQGIPVFPGDLTFNRNSANRIYLVSSGLRPQLSLGVQPGISATDAKQRAVKICRGGTAQSPTLAVWAYSRPYRLVWQVQVRVRPDQVYRVVLDAQSGQLIGKSNLIAHVDEPKADVYLSNPVATPTLTTVPMFNLTDPDHLTGKYVNLNRFTSYNAMGDILYEQDLQPGANGYRLLPTDTKFDEPMAYFQVNRWHDFFHDTLGFAKRDTSLPVIVGTTNPDGSPLNNAFYDPTHDFLNFGKFTDGRDLALDADIIGHEYTHSVADTLTKILFNESWTESRAINEATADYFSSTVVGEGCLSEYGSPQPGTCMRDLTNRKHYPEEVPLSHPLKNGAAYYDLPEEHYTGEIWGAALWDLRRSLGAPVADQLIFASLPLYPDTATFSDAYVALQAADSQLKTDAAATLTEIMNKRGIPLQMKVSYAIPFQFSEDNAHVVLTGNYYPGYGVLPSGFLPVFVAGREYTLPGFLGGYANVQSVDLLFMNDKGDAVYDVPANFNEVPAPDGSGSVTAFQFDFYFPPEGIGDYTVAIGATADGQSLRFSNALPGKIIQDAGPTADPSKELISFPPAPVPDGNPTPAPIAPSTIQISPPGAQITLGNSIKFSATVADASGTSLSNAFITWGLEDPKQIAEIHSDGTLIARRTGSVTVTAHIGSVKSVVAVDVLPAVAPTGVNAWKQVPGSEKDYTLALSASNGGGKNFLYEAGWGIVRVKPSDQPFLEALNGFPKDPMVWTVSASPVDSTVAYVGTLNQGLFRTTDSGATWNQYARDLVDPDLTMTDIFYPQITAVFADPTQSDRVLIGTQDYGAYIKPDEKTAWGDISDGLGSAAINSFTVSPDAYFAGTDSGAYRFSGGNAWVPINEGLDSGAFNESTTSEPAYVNQLTFNPKNPKELLAATQDSGIFYSADSGDHWKRLDTGALNRTVYTVAFDPTVTGRMFAGTDTDGIIVSSDNGKTWNPARAGLTCTTIASLIFDPTTPSLLYAGTYGEGVWSLDTTGKVVSEGIKGPPLGDVNNDSQINVSDAVLVLKSVVKLVTLTTDQFAAADVNQDGLANVADAIKILRVAVHIDPPFPS